MKVFKIRFVLPAILLAAIVAVAACQRAEPAPDRDRLESQRHLRNGLIALEGGDSRRAESELKRSLELDASNERSLTTLASLYAGEAGVDLRSWLEPVLDSATGLLERSRRIERVNQALRRAREDHDRKKNPFPGPSPRPSLRPEDIDPAGARSAELARFFLGAQALAEVFHAFPVLDDVRVAKLDRAIDVLRVPSLAPHERPEGARVYLAVLSFVRLITHVKRLVVDPETDEVDLSLGRFCQMRLPGVTANLAQVRASLHSLHEGLVMNGEAETPQRRARVRLEGFVARYFDLPIWEGHDGLSLSTRVALDRACRRPLDETIEAALLTSGE